MASGHEYRAEFFGIPVRNLGGVFRPERVRLYAGWRHICHEDAPRRLHTHGGANALGRAGRGDLLGELYAENYMPMMRMAIYAKGLAFYCAPTADDRDTWAATMTHIALEGRCFVLSACQYLARANVMERHRHFKQTKSLEERLSEEAKRLRAEQLFSLMAKCSRVSPHSKNSTAPPIAAEELVETHRIAPRLTLHLVANLIR
jgi:hypothetical protein